MRGNGRIHGWERRRCPMARGTWPASGAIVGNQSSGCSDGRGSPTGTRSVRTTTGVDNTTGGTLANEAGTWPQARHPKPRPGGTLFSSVVPALNAFSRKRSPQIPEARPATKRASRKGTLLESNGGVGPISCGGGPKRSIRPAAAQATSASRRCPEHSRAGDFPPGEPDTGN